MDKKPSLRNPQSFINGIERTDEFLGHLSKGKNRAAAIGLTAATLHERMSKAEAESRVPESPQSKLDRYSVGLIATVSKFVEAQHALDKLKDEKKRGHKISRNVMLPHLKAAIPYNHILREMVDSFSNESPANILRFTATTTLSLGSPAEAGYCKEETRKVLYGMQHELSLAHTLWQIDGVEDVQYATEEQELEGIDLVVKYRDRTIYLDAKASEFGEKKALAERAAFMSTRGLSEAETTGGYPIWTGLEDEDFKGCFRIDDETAEAHAPAIKLILDDIYAKKYLAA